MSDKPQFAQPLVSLQLTAAHVRDVKNELERAQRDVEYEIDAGIDFSAPDDVMGIPAKISGALVILRILRDGLEAQERAEAKKAKPDQESETSQPNVHFQ